MVLDSPDCVVPVARDHAYGYAVRPRRHIAVLQVLPLAGCRSCGSKSSPVPGLETNKRKGAVTVGTAGTVVVTTQVEA